MHLANYFIHGYSVGSDHSPVHVELHIGSGEGRKISFKWNISYLKKQILDKMEEKWKSMPEDATFFYKIRNIGRFYRLVSKQKTMVNRKMELDTLAKLEVATANLHKDINNFEKQGEVNRLREVMGSIETKKANEAALRSRVKWL